MLLNCCKVGAGKRGGEWRVDSRVGGMGDAIWQAQQEQRVRGTEDISQIKLG